MYVFYYSLLSVPEILFVVFLQKSQQLYICLKKMCNCSPQ